MANVWLGRWLVLVGALRVLSTVMGLMNPAVLQQSLYPLAQEFTPLAGRIFAAWTGVTCALCFLCAHSGCAPDSPVFMATMASFVLALAHFGMELVVFKTMSVRSIASPGIVATISLCWMSALMLRTTPRQSNAKAK